jgi:hypothetical protein
MDQASIRSTRIMAARRASRLTVLAPAPVFKDWAGLFRSAEISSQATAGNIGPIVHTARAFGPTAQQAAT